MADEISVLIQMAEILDAHGIDYMLTGSMALNVYANPRMTRDIDLVVILYLKDAARIGSIFKSEHFYVSADAAREAVLHESSFNIIELTTMTKVDIMIRKSDAYRHLEFSRRRKVVLRGKEVWVVTKEDLVISKLEWARESLSERQLEDVKNLLATGCDMDYLKSWASKLQLNDLLTRATA